MQVKDFLSGRLAISQEKINTFAFNAAATDSLTDTHCCLEQVHAGSLVCFGNVNKMLSGYDHDLSRINGANVHKSKRSIVLVDKTGRCLAFRNIAEYAITHIAGLITAGAAVAGVAAIAGTTGTGDAGRHSGTAGTETGKCRHFTSGGFVAMGTLSPLVRLTQRA